MSEEMGAQRDTDKSWSSVMPGIGARQMELILLHTLQTRKMFEFVALPPYRVYH